MTDSIITDATSFEMLVDRINDLELSIQHQMCWHMEKMLELNDNDQLTDTEWNNQALMLTRLETLLNSVELLRERQVK
jgi:hypothetical protein